MRKVSVRAAVATAAMLVLAACGDTRLDKLTLGISKDSAATVIGDPPHRTLSYVAAGKLWDIQMYSRKRAADADSVAWREMSPLVFIDHKLVGWGWTWWGPEAAKMGFAMPAK